MGHLPKYHVVDCRTLKAMRRAGRYKRYVVGEFILNFADISREIQSHTDWIFVNCFQELNEICRLMLDWQIGFIDLAMRQKMDSNFSLVQLVSTGLEFASSSVARGQDGNVKNVA